MQFSVVTYITATMIFQAAGRLIVKPVDSHANVNSSTYFNCSTDLESKDIFWFHETNYVYTGFAILQPYHERFKVDRIVSNETYSYNLVIHSVKPGDAGKYICSDDEVFGEQYSVQLIGLENDLTCRSNKVLEEVIGQNTCNIEPDDVELECRVTYYGNIPPQMEWKKIRKNSSTPMEASISNSKNQFALTLKLRGDIALNDSSYVCETERTTQESNNCTTQVIKILYAQSDNLTVNATIDDEVHCKANTSQSCSYRWKWLQDNDFTIESSTAILRARKPGWHRCEAECSLGNKTCPLLVMRTMVYGETITVVASSQTRNIIISVVVSVGVTFVAVCVLIVVLAYCCNKEIWDLTVLHQEVFILRERRRDIEVYDSTEFHFKGRMKVDGMVDPRGIASCSVNNCLYIVDRSHEELRHAIFRIDPINGNLIKAWKLTGVLSHLSVASDTNVITCPVNGVELYEYTADGELIRTIHFGRNPVDITQSISAMQAVKLDNGLFVICQYDPSEIYLFSPKATSSTLGRIDEVEILKKFSEESSDLIDSSWRPMYLSVDKEGSILVTDGYYDRVVLMNSNLGEARILISEEDGMESSWKTCFNESTGEWLMIDRRRIFVCRVKGESIVRQIYDLISH